MGTYIVIRKEFSERLRDLMNEKGLNANQLAKAVKIPPKTLSHWLNEERSAQTDALWKIADFFDVSVDYLIGRTEQY